MGRKFDAAELKPGSWYAFNTVIGPSPQGPRFVRVECWSCKGIRDVTVDNLLGGKTKRCRRCSQAARGARYQMSGGLSLQDLGEIFNA